MCREVDIRLRKLLCYRENAFWANIRKKIKFFKPFGLDPPPYLGSRNNIPGTPWLASKLPLNIVHESYSQYDLPADRAEAVGHKDDPEENFVVYLATISYISFSDYIY